MDASTEAPRRKRGPAPRISRRAVLDVAKRLPQDQLTMAAISAELGVTAGALYRYFPDRAAVLDMLALEEREALEPPDASLPWRQWLEEGIRKERALWQARPELRDGAGRMATRGPALRMLQVGLEVLTSQGFSSSDALTAIAACSNVAYSLTSWEDLVPAEKDLELAAEAASLVEKFELDKIDMDVLAQQVIDLTLDGIATRLPGT